MSDQVADVLDDAADLIERGGLVKEALYDGEGAFCSVGALYEVCSTPSLRMDAYTAIYSFTGGCSVADWNNAPERTKQQVLDTFRLAAKRERMPPIDSGGGGPDPRVAPPAAGLGLPGDAPMSG
jgi:hypothetical protein